MYKPLSEFYYRTDRSGKLKSEHKNVCKLRIRKWRRTHLHCGAETSLKWQRAHKDSVNIILKRG